MALSDVREVKAGDGIQPTDAKEWGEGSRHLLQAV